MSAWTDTARFRLWLHAWAEICEVHLFLARHSTVRHGELGRLLAFAHIAASSQCSVEHHEREDARDRAREAEQVRRAS